jgi:hypothetical protein
VYDDENEIERTYWRFDSLVRGNNIDRREAGLGPMPERDAFKHVLRYLLHKRDLR